MRADLALAFGTIILAGPRVAYSEPDPGSDFAAEGTYESRTSYVTERPPCLDPNDVNGYRRCPHFGTWGDNLLGPNFFIEIGMNFRHFASGAAPTSTGRSTIPTMTTSPVATGPDDARTYVERFGFGVSHFYVAAEFEFGSFGEMRVGSRDLVLDGVLALGVRTRLGPVTIAGELDGGGMTYTYAYQSAQEDEAIADARARGYVWLTPWFTAGAMVGTSLIHSERTIGVYIGLHTYAFGGSP